MLIMAVVILAQEGIVERRKKIDRTVRVCGVINIFTFDIPY